MQLNLDQCHQPSTNIWIDIKNSGQEYNGTLGFALYVSKHLGYATSLHTTYPTNLIFFTQVLTANSTNLLAALGKHASGISMCKYLTVPLTILHQAESFILFY